MAQDPPKLRYDVGSVVVPGDRIGSIRLVAPAKGTYVRGGNIYACIVGSLRVTAIEEEPTKQKVEMDVDGDGDEAKDTKIEFECSVEPVAGKIPASCQVLTAGQLVVGRIVRITPQNAIVEISVAEKIGTLPNFQEGAIRTEDILPGGTAITASEQISLASCFQPGDLVACRIISLGDARRYFLSTAEKELGVIRAMRRGVPMIPISWKEVVCPKTGAREARKCAKPPVKAEKS